jgi:hypothetical protein
MMRVVVVSLRLLAATIPMMPMITTAPTTIQSHGVLVVVLVVVVPSVVVVLSVVVAEPALGAAIVPLPAVPLLAEPLLVEPLVAGPVVVVVVEPDVFDVCAKAIIGAMARKSARSTKLSRKIGRMWVLPSESGGRMPPAQEIAE